MNLMQRINEVRKLIRYVQKDKSVSTGKGSYLAVTHDMVTAMVRPHMITHGIVCFPSLVDAVTVQPPPKSDGTEKQLRYEAIYDFTFANMDDPADRLVIRIQSHANDGGDKAPGKAISYAKKYALLKLFEIESGEDEESRVHDPDAFPVEDHLAAIEAAADMDSLKKAYARGFTLAGEAKNKQAQKQIIAAKDARKATLEGANK